MTFDPVATRKRCEAATQGPWKFNENGVVTSLGPWKCCGCGSVSKDTERTCDCPTECLYREGDNTREVKTYAADPLARHIRDLCLQARRAALQEVLDECKRYREKPNTYSETAAHIEQFVEGLISE